MISASDWSILVPNETDDPVTAPPSAVEAVDSRSASVGGIPSSPFRQPPSTARRRKRRGTAIRREQPVSSTSGGDDKSTAVTANNRVTVASVLHNAATAAALAQRARTLSLLQSLTLDNHEARGSFDTCRYNRTHHMNSRSRHITTMGVDRQRTKCLYRGAMTSKAYQRPQVARLAGSTSDNGGRDQFTAANVAASGRMARKSRA
ncbi:unnamed protein product [Schistocephalus solidus]|uniref:Uncharacterized protein n=1 Tax=Schistocephalus solidus TaxID=70667 RepID=A0A183SYN5_SCHSO|nr:unnamed protein product [Schistocephalus solidus]